MSDADLSVRLSPLPTGAVEWGQALKELARPQGTV